MKIVHSSITEVKQVQPKKQVSMRNDPVLKAEFRRSFIEDHNRKIKSKQA